MSGFRETILACIAAEQNLWRIGDALCIEIDDNSDLKPQLKEAAEELARNGINYTFTYLGIIRKTAKQFKSNERRSDIPFHIHRVACTVENLEIIIDYARETNAKITEGLVRTALDTMRERVNKKRKELKDAAIAEKERAKREKHNAIQRIKNSTDTSIVEAAILDKKRAERDYREALKREKDIRISPDVKRLPAGSVAPIIDRTSMLRAAEEAKAQARQANRTLSKSINNLPPEVIDGLLEAFVEVLTEWQNNANMLRRKQYHPGSHLSAVN